MFSENVGFYKTGFWLFLEALEGLGSSGRLIGTISTYPGTYKCPGSRAMTKNLVLKDLFFFSVFFWMFSLVVFVFFPLTIRYFSTRHLPIHPLNSPEHARKYPSKIM